MVACFSDVMRYVAGANGRCFDDGAAQALEVWSAGTAALEASKADFITTLRRPGRSLMVGR